MVMTVRSHTSAAVKPNAYLLTRMSRNRDKGGRFIEKVSLDDVLAVFDEQNEPMTGTEVGNTLEISNRSALDKLNELHERGDIERKKVGARSVVWWLTDERARGGSAEPLRGLVGLVDDEGAQRVRERSREFREEFNERMDRRRNGLTERNADEE